MARRSSAYLDGGLIGTTTSTATYETDDYLMAAT